MRGIGRQSGCKNSVKFSEIRQFINICKSNLNFHHIVFSPEQRSSTPPKTDSCATKPQNKNRNNGICRFHVVQRVVMSRHHANGLKDLEILSLNFLFSRPTVSLNYTLSNLILRIYLICLPFVDFARSGGRR